MDLGLPLFPSELQTITLGFFSAGCLLGTLLPSTCCLSEAARVATVDNKCVGTVAVQPIGCASSACNQQSGLLVGTGAKHLPSCLAWRMLQKSPTGPSRSGPVDHYLGDKEMPPDCLELKLNPLVFYFPF